MCSDCDSFSLGSDDYNVAISHSVRELMIKISITLDTSQTSFQLGLFC